MCFRTRRKISKDKINIVPTYGMEVGIINRYSVFLTINKNEKRKSLLREFGRLHFRVARLFGFDECCSV